MNLSRRNFLGAASAFSIVPASVFGANAPSNRIVMGMIGAGREGGMGTGNMKSFLGLDDVVVRAVCDVNAKHRAHGKEIVDQRYGNTDCDTYADFRDLCVRPDIDAVMIATPDHWHAYVGTFAASCGKDIYGEKPFTHDLREGRALVNAVERYGRVWQTGSWQRATGEMRRAVELVRNGRLGKIARVEVGLPGGGRGRKSVPGTPVPQELDWDMWLGPAPYRAFQGVYDGDWRWVLEWGGGQLMDWIGHHMDIAAWGLDRDRTGPVKFQGWAPYEPEGIYDSFKSYRVKCTYADGLDLTVADSGKVRSGATWYGADGSWISVDRGRLSASSDKLLESRVEAGELRFESNGHQRDFIDAVKTRATTSANAEVAHRSASVGHLCQIALLTGRTIAWDPAKEQILGDPAAATLLGRKPRGGWKLY